ncbi:MAG: PrsW family glutamic-type intramembrane protease [Kineosporiaceae bacterium]
MLALAMVLAACWGVLQLAVLGSASRSLRIGTLLLAVAVGAYGCGVAVLTVQFILTRVWAAAVPGVGVADAVRAASYTVDPVVEEIAKILPLLAAALWWRTRGQWGITDHTVAGAGIGAGFGLLEALLRFGDDADRAVAVDGGWLLPLSLSPPFVPSPGLAVTSWLPAPVSSELFGFAAEAGTNQHLVWSAVAGFGVGVLVRVRGPWRVLGVVPTVLVSADHAAGNYDVVVSQGTLLGDAVTAPFRWAEPALGLWALLALAAAVVLDLRRVQASREAHPEVLLAAESPAVLGEWPEAARYATLRSPWAAFVAWRFVLTRRAALNAAAPGGSGGGRAGALVSDVADARVRLDVTRTPAAWQGIGLRSALRMSRSRPRTGALLRRFWPVLVWLVLLTPGYLYYGVGTTPLTAGAQDLLVSPAVLPVLLVLLVAGLGWTAWQTIVAVRALPAAARLALAEPAVRVAARLAVGAGAVVAGVVVGAAALRGAEGDDRVIRNAHALDAVSDLLLVGGIALLLAALVFFPPVAAVAVAGGGVILVPTLTSGFVALGTLGVGGILLSQAAEGASTRGRGSGGGGPSGGRVPDIPQQPPRPQPRVRHWKLRNIVDNLWHGSTRSDRIGDGTTMAALRNEIRTGRPTQGTFHRDKVERELRALKNWLRQYEKSASEPDVDWARKLRRELESLLREAS